MEGVYRRRAAWLESCGEKVATIEQPRKKVNARRESRRPPAVALLRTGGLSH